MAAAAIDVGYLAASYAVPETTLQSLLSEPTVALVQSLLTLANSYSVRVSSS